MSVFSDVIREKMAASAKKPPAKRPAVRRIDWTKAPMSQFAPEIDKRLVALQRQATQLETMGHLLDPAVLEKRQMALARAAQQLEEIHGVQTARNLRDYQQPFASKGLSPEPPRDASFLNRVTGNKKIFGRTWGTAASKPAEAHRAKDVASALGRARSVAPMSGAAQAGSLGALAKLGLGAGALLGGGYLLKNMAGDDESSQVPGPEGQVWR